MRVSGFTLCPSTCSKHEIQVFPSKKEQTLWSRAMTPRFLRPTCSHSNESVLDKHNGDKITISDELLLPGYVQKASLSADNFLISPRR